jgi:pentapeptide MXKDX repeat protein
MKTTKVLSAVSAAALLGISSFALAQGTAPGSSGSTMQKEQPSSGSMGKDSMSKDSLKPNQAQDKSNMKSNQAQTPGAADSKAQMTQDKGKETSKDLQKSQTQTQTQAPGAADSKSKMSQDKDAAKSGATVGAATTGGVNLTTEQRTTIRQTVLTSSAPRATNINFAINVGTVVPSTVRVVEVPDTIIRINPRWKGYRYFVYNDEIIIVEPRTLKIVAVLDV